MSKEYKVDVENADERYKAVGYKPHPLPVIASKAKQGGANLEDLIL